jgi:hypothetical protein
LKLINNPTSQLEGRGIDGLEAGKHRRDLLVEDQVIVEPRTVEGS